MSRNPLDNPATKAVAAMILAQVKDAADTGKMQDVYEVIDEWTKANEIDIESVEITSKDQIKSIPGLQKYVYVCTYCDDVLVFTRRYVRRHLLDKHPMTTNARLAKFWIVKR